ncbi:MAG: hypothetical protein K8T10_12615 [Candidatus Eremiobacteraeota bacterium]|nr:hypothetical protein [Candidatus Eremiobacteraeota bacterium]
MKKEKNNLKSIMILGILAIILIGVGYVICSYVFNLGKKAPPSALPAVSPEETFDNYIKATKTADVTKIRHFISSQHQHEFDKLDEKQMKARGEFIKNTAPTKYKTTGRKIMHDKAMLLLEGNAKSFIEGSSAKYGKVIFHLESGKWKIYKLHWADKPESLPKK